VKKWLKTSVVALAAVLLTVGLAACGSSKSSTSGSSNSTGASSTTSTQTTEDVSLGEKAGKEAGSQVALPKIKAGVLNLGRVSESGARAEVVIDEALKTIGWSNVSCDSGGSAAKMASCGETLLNEGAKVLYLIAIPPEAIMPTLKRAKAEGVPVISYAGGTTPSDLMSGQYEGLEAEQGKVAGEHLLELLKGVKGEKQVALFSSFVNFAATRAKTFKETIASEPEIKIVTQKEVNPEDSIGSTEKNTSAVLNQYPKLSAIVTTWDDAIVGSARAIQQKDPGAQFPARPLLLSFDAVKVTQPWIKRGVVDGVADVANDTPAWAAVDQAAAFFARKAKISHANPTYPGITLMKVQWITKDNLPAEGTYVPPTFEPAAYFGAKWKAEYTK
jgi:ribose transport system substrate-binding protein